MNKKMLYYTGMSILLGLVVGAVIFALVGVNPLEAYKVMILGAFGKPKFISWTIVEAVPIILTGIAVAFAFQTGILTSARKVSSLWAASPQSSPGWYFTCRR